MGISDWTNLAGLIQQRNAWDSWESVVGKVQVFGRCFIRYNMYLLMNRDVFDSIVKLMLGIRHGRKDLKAYLRPWCTSTIFTKGM